ncbi:MAG TPA: cobyrinic acid a,c-diamide synthase [Parachlamydiales bacterium]|nr:cobyrinic acid a,c-diamide synthase [Parachlamydiales bacterium]
MMKNGIFIAATGQNVGKTAVCLGLVSGLQKRCSSVGYMKPVGQEHVETEKGDLVDKDVVVFKTHFSLVDSYSTMSPVLFPRRFTRDFLDGKIERQELVDRIEGGFANLSARHEMTVVEGTGHTGVGSIVDLNNAQVAALLDIPLFIVTSGGLGSSFDELSLNLAQCEKYGAKVAGVILNRVFEEKRAMIMDYMGRALERWRVPLLGCIPYHAFLSSPTMKDFEQLFQTELVTGQAFRLRHFEHIRLVATSVEMYRHAIGRNQLVITPASRDDIVLATLTRFWDLKIAHSAHDLQAGLILTGKQPPKEALIEQIKRAEIPMLYAPVSNFTAMKMINSFTSKIRQEDTPKIQRAIDLMASHIDFDRLLGRY